MGALVRTYCTLTARPNAMRTVASPGCVQRQEDVMDAVIKIYCTHTEPNYSLPWQRKRQFSSTSSGFVVAADGEGEGGSGGPRYLLTNAHSVEHHSQVGRRVLPAGALASCSTSSCRWCCLREAAGGVAVGSWGAACRPRRAQHGAPHVLCLCWVGRRLP